MRARFLSLVVLVLLGCGSKDAPAPPAAEGSAGGSAARFGPLMLQIGHRLELSGQAAQAGRWELATYEVEELIEVYEGPLLEAPAPPEIHARIEPFIESCLDPLEDAARTHDMARFQAAYATTTLGCNACHAEARVGFIEIPSEVGASVPRITPATTPEGPPAGTSPEGSPPAVPPSP